MKSDASANSGHSPVPAEPQRLGRGSNQRDLRAYNERLLLSLIRTHQKLSKTDLARLTGLSAQTTSVIIRSLEADQLLVRGAPVRGRKGQPSTPMSINPDGAFFFGLSIGRRNAELVLIDFAGTVRAVLHAEYAYPMPQDIIEFARNGVKTLTGELRGKLRKRIEGLGVAVPFDLWAWAETAGAPADEMEQWRRADIRTDLERELSYPVYAQNDATAACGAELVFGETRDISDYLYFFVGYFVGGGIVLNGSLYQGRSGNAGALGSMLVPQSRGKPVQLLQVASLSVLEQSMSHSVIDSSVFWTEPENWSALEPQISRWIDTAAQALAHAIISAVSVIDFEATVIDGWMPDEIRARLVQAIDTRLHALPGDGIELPQVLTGSVGIHANALGAAALVLAESFLVDRNALD